VYCDGHSIGLFLACFLLYFLQRNWVFATNSDFLIHRSTYQRLNSLIFYHWLIDDVFLINVHILYAFCPSHLKCSKGEDDNSFYIWVSLYGSEAQTWRDVNIVTDYPMAVVRMRWPQQMVQDSRSFFIQLKWL